MIIEWALLGVLVAGVAYLVYSGRQAKSTARTTRGDHRLDAMYERVAAKKEADLQRLVQSGNDDALYARYPRDEVRAALQKYGGTTTGARAPAQADGRSFEKYRASRSDSRVKDFHRLIKMAGNGDTAPMQMQDALDATSKRHGLKAPERLEGAQGPRIVRGDRKHGQVVRSHLRDGKRIRSYRRKPA